MLSYRSTLNDSRPSFGSLLTAFHPVEENILAELPLCLMRELYQCLPFPYLALLVQEIERGFEICFLNRHSRVLLEGHCHERGTVNKKPAKPLQRLIIWNVLQCKVQNYVRFGVLEPPEFLCLWWVHRDVKVIVHFDWSACLPLSYKGSLWAVGR